MRGRALGDTTSITSVASMKSQAWYDLQGQNGFVPFLNKAFTLLRTYASTHEVVVDTAFDVPISSSDLASMFNMPTEVASAIKLTTTLLITAADTKHFSIYANIAFTQTGDFSNVGTVKVRIDIDEAEAGQQMKFFMLFDLENPTTGDRQHVPYYVSFDSATGSYDGIYVPAIYNGQTKTENTSEGLERTMLGTDGSITNVRLSRANGELNYIDTAYGDDVAGGIASYGVWTDDDTGDVHDEYWGEYYGTGGNLVKRVNGDSKLWVPIWTGTDAPPVLNLHDLGYATAPATVEKKDYWVDGSNYMEVKNAAGVWVKAMKSTWLSATNTWSTQYSEDGTNWTLASNKGAYRSIVFQNTSGTWSGGDIVYYWQNGTWGQVDGVWCSTSTLYQGYVAPAPVAKFGRPMFMTNEYPLDTLLPLQGTYATEYQLIQQEQNTYSGTWTDNEGTNHDYSYTGYNYYLNKNKVDESPIRENASDGDIGLGDKLNQEEMYYWINGQESKALGYFYRTTGALPLYFNNPDTSLVSLVDAKLDQAITTAYTLDASAFADQLTICRNDPTAGKF